MIHTDLYQYIEKDNKKVVKSHRLHPSDGICIFFIITGLNPSIISILEDHMLESLSAIEWEDDTLLNDFTYISENFNHFIHNIADTDLDQLGVILGVLSGSNFIFSHIGETSILLIEKGDIITNLSNTDTSKTEFQAISNGEIQPGSQIYLSNISIENRLSDDLIHELSSLNIVEWRNIIGDIIKKEIQESVHIGYIMHDIALKELGKIGRGKQLDIMRQGAEDFLSRINFVKKIQYIQTIILDKIYTKQTAVKYILLIIGGAILISLIYFIFSTISSVLSSPANDTKNQLLQAQELIENSQKMITNPQSFNTSIAEAEAILFELRDKRAHMTDTQSLLSRIEAMKKEVNDVQTIDVSKLNSIMYLDTTSSTPLGIFEYDKKVSLIMQESAIIGHARGGLIPEAKSYPTGMKAQDFDITEDGIFYILANDNRILSQRGQEIVSVATNGKSEWDTSHILATFNGNIYMPTVDKRGINRYRPGINGFSTPNTIVSKLEDDIIDLGIDGGIYILLKNGKVTRYIGGTTSTLKNITINKIPGEYNIGSEDLTKLFVKPNLSYIYILSGRNIWIFSPDSRRFQDVTAWNYIAQLELQGQEEIKNIYVPRDGLIYIATSHGVRELIFEIADGKIILR